MVEDIEASLTAAFPESPMERSLIDEATALWSAYDDADELSALEGKTWREVPADWLVRHPSLLVYAGDGLFRAVLPAYLRYLLHERTQFNALPFQVASQLTRNVEAETHTKFDRRIASFTPAQRDAVRDVLRLLASVRPLEETMSAALAAWPHPLSGEA